MSLRSGALTRLDAIRDAARTSLWPVPVIWVVAALVAGVALPRLDRAVDDQLPIWLSAALFGGGPSAARVVLGAVASSLITVTSLTFSLTVVTLQLASSQFSPRLLRTFTRDRFVHVTLGVFLATFTFALTVLRTVPSVQEDGVVFVPQLAVTMAFVLAVASVLTMVLFLAHLTREIRVETMRGRVRDDATRAAHRADVGDGIAVQSVDAGSLAWFEPPPSALPLIAGDSGFVLQVEEKVLLEVAERSRVVLRVDVPPGCWVVAGTPVGSYWALGPDTDPEAASLVSAAVEDAITMGPERTSVQDLEFGLRQLSDVSTRALSPGINDPTTAVHALGQASALLCELAARRPGPLVLGADRRGGQRRVLLARMTFAELLEVVVAPACRYGSGDPDILTRVLTLLREVAWLGPRRWEGADLPQASDSSPVTDAVRQQLHRVRAVVAASSLPAGDITTLDHLQSRVEAALAGRW